MRIVNAQATGKKTQSAGSGHRKGKALKAEFIQIQWPNLHGKGQQCEAGMQQGVGIFLSV